MATTEDLPELFPQPLAQPDFIQINRLCRLHTAYGRRVVSVAGITVAQYSSEDRMSEAYAMVSLVEQGHAAQGDVAAAFGYSSRTVRRSQERFAAGGLAALARPAGYPKGQPRLPKARSRLVISLKGSGHSNCDIARRLGVSEKAIRKQLKRLGWREKGPIQPLLMPPAASDPNLSGPAAVPLEDACVRNARTSDPNLSACALPATLDRNPGNRVIDRLLARAGLIEDAVPLFSPGSGVPRAGVLLAIPALLRTGVLECAKHVYGDLGPAFYGLRTTVLTLLLMALLRIKRPEALKEHAPPDLGRLLGLDRAPEVKTLRRKLAELAAFNRAAAFGMELAKRRVAAHSGALGFLYFDGHVRVYHGKHAIPKAHVARMRLPMPATSDYWVNDQRGDPLFVVTAQANAGMVKMLPPMLRELRTLVGERRVTVVFDRGGWSPKLFLDMIAHGFDILTYRKGRVRPIPQRGFALCAAKPGGRKVEYMLADRGIRLLGGKLRLRQVTRLTGDGHQTHVITSRRDLPAIEVAWRMFERWRQENFFKYMREEYALDALAEHALEPDDPARTVPNPARKALDARVHKARLELQVAAARYGLDAFGNTEALRRTMRGFKIAAAGTGKAIAAARRRLEALERRRAAMPVRVPVSQIAGGEVVRLATERQHLNNCLKMVAYQAESDLARLVAKHYRRAEDEGRTLIQSALGSRADLIVSGTELQVVLAPMSSPHRSRAVAKLCEELNGEAAVFPGSNLRLRYRVADTV